MDTAVFKLTLASAPIEKSRCRRRQPMLNERLAVCRNDSNRFLVSRSIDHETFPRCGKQQQRGMPSSPALDFEAGHHCLCILPSGAASIAYLDGMISKRPIAYRFDAAVTR